MSGWAENYRQRWIAETLYVFGYINRTHLTRKFDISEAQTAIDFRRFLVDHPGMMHYDTTQKRYVATTLAMSKRHLNEI